MEKRIEKNNDQMKSIQEGEEKVRQLSEQELDKVVGSGDLNEALFQSRQNYLKNSEKTRDGAIVLPELP